MRTPPTAGINERPPGLRRGGPGRARRVDPAVRGPSLGVAPSSWARSKRVRAGRHPRPRRGGAPPADDPQMSRGAVTSIQAAGILAAGPRGDLDAARISSAWRGRTGTFLSRCTLGIIRIRYTEAERFVVLLSARFVPALFRAPEYEMDADARHRALAHREGRARHEVRPRRRGYLEIEVRRRPPATRRPRPARRGRGRELLSVARLSGIGNWFYANTQSRIHVIVTHGFLYPGARATTPPR